MKETLKALEKLEGLCHDLNVDGFVRIAQYYNMLGEYDRVIENCDKALAVDEACIPALHEKLLAAFSLNDANLVGNISDELFEVSDNNLISLLPLIMANSFSGNYEKSLDIIENCELGDVGEEERMLLKYGVYNWITEDLNAQIMLSREVLLDIDVAIRLMLEFKETGKDHGEIDGVQYFIT